MNLGGATQNFHRLLQCLPILIAGRNKVSFATDEGIEIGHGKSAFECALPNAVDQWHASQLRWAARTPISHVLRLLPYLRAAFSRKHLDESRDRNASHIRPAKAENVILDPDTARKRETKTPSLFRDCARSPTAQSCMRRFAIWIASSQVCDFGLSPNRVPRYGVSRSLDMAEQHHPAMRTPFLAVRQNRTILPTLCPAQNEGNLCVSMKLQKALAGLCYAIGFLQALIASHIA